MEITEDIQVTFEQESLIDMHSIMNTLNLLSLELYLVNRRVGGYTPIDLILQEIHRIGRALYRKETAHYEAAKLESLIHKIREAVTAARLLPGVKEELPKELERSALNIESIITVMRVRIREIIARADDAYAWVTHSIGELHHNFRVVFDAIQRNSKGAYKIVENTAQHGKGDYLIELVISSSEDSTIRMPAVFQDVMRDLIANARKYTPPGGRILAELENDGNELHFRVQDTGVGIKPDELERVVVFGVRGSNVLQRPTRGGGFGLTKAYFVTRRCGGRMWIESQLNRGTRIDIVLPVPEDVQQR
ncbi:MAG: ATP-binding protein [Spirochaeta sp.]